MRKTVAVVLIISVQLAAILPCRAQADSVAASHRKEPSLFSVAAGIQHGFIFAHSQAVQNTKGARPTGVEMILSWQRNDAVVWDLCNCYPRKGLLLSYYDYDRALLGKSATAAFFLEPVYLASRTWPVMVFGFCALSISGRKNRNRRVNPHGILQAVNARI